MRRILLFIFLVGFFAAAVAAWIFLGSGTAFHRGSRNLYIASNAATKEAVLDSLRKNNIISNETAFTWLASRRGYWNRIRPGKYEIANGASLLSIVRRLYNGQQSEVRLSFNKLRTRGDLARMVGNRFECDSADMMRFLSSSDSLQNFGVDPETAMTLVLPDTYTYYWNTTPRRIYKKLADAAGGFWDAKRIAAAKKLGLTQAEVYTIASIVEEETNSNKDKGKIASVYLNRVKKGMPLQADPTVKFALQDFGLKRIYQKHTQVPSPYNTYVVKGLPPGPICTPSRKTIDAVLDAPQTDYYYFVASPALDGSSVFSRTYDEHLVHARAYQQELNRIDSTKKSGTP